MAWRPFRSLRSSAKPKQSRVLPDDTAQVGVPPEDFDLGRRIVVWGVTGSGKTTLSRRLGEACGLGVIEVDAIRHAGRWNAVSFDDMRPVLSRRLAEFSDGWVLDGNYVRLGDLYLPDADTLIWLHLPWRVSFWRLFKRTVSRAWTREPAYGPDGPRESWRLTFLSRDSILWWSISQHRVYRRNFRERIASLPPHIAVYELRTQREVDAFLARLGLRIGRETPPRSSRSAG
jgi:adenylate kinase family enzyme